MIPTTPLSLQPPGWQQLWREAVTDPAELLDLLGLAPLKSRLATEGMAFPLRVPRGYVGRMRHGDPTDPLLRQVLPLDEEDRIVPGFVLDAVGDLAARDAPGVLHKYAGRALLVTTGSCAIHCRYCFRRHFPYGEELAARGQWREAVATISADPSLHEVLLSGGDPWSLSTAKLRELTDQLRAIPHLKRLRIHTRLPIVLPERIDTELCDWLRSLPWPPHLAKVPDIAATHHEKLDGRGYPRGLGDSDLTIEDRIMAIADIFEALTAADRPYKSPKTLSESFSIMARMAHDRHICPIVFAQFLRSGVWRSFSSQFLLPTQIDDVDVEALIERLPKPPAESGPG